MMLASLPARRASPRAEDGLLPARPLDRASCAEEALIHLSEAIRRLALATQEREDLSATQIRVLDLLARYPAGLVRSVAAEMLDRSLPALLQALVTLEMRRLVARLPIADRSRCRIALTPLGRETFDRLSRWDDPLRTSMGALGVKDRACITRIASAVAAHIESVQAAAT